MKKILIFILTMIVPLPCFPSQQPKFTQNMVTINGILHRRLPQANYLVTTDKKLPSYWILSKIRSSNGNEQVESSVVLYGLKKHLGSSDEDVLYPLTCYEIIEKKADKLFRNGKKYSNKEEALKSVTKHHQDNPINRNSYLPDFIFQLFRPIVPLK